MQKNNPRNIKYLSRQSVIIFYTCLDLGQKSSFLGEH